MRGLTHPTRRRFGRGLGCALTLAALPRRGSARGGTHETEVRIARFAYYPARVEIRAGDSVTWINDDLAPHTATADDGAWSTGTLDRDGTSRITFETAGEHRYFCAFHPHMEGVAVVHPKTGG